MPKTATSLRPHIVQVMATRQGCILTTEEIYGLVADLGVAGFNPNAKRDRNLVNRELSDLAGHATQGHSKPSPQPHHLRFEVDHIVALSDDGEHETCNLQLLCPCCNRVKGTQGSHGFRMNMAELRAHNVGTGVMVDEREAALTGRRLAQYHQESGNAAS